MPDLFDNFFGKISKSMNGGKTTYYHSGNSQVNAGRHYSYHENSTNNKYWMTAKDIKDQFAESGQNADVKPRMGSVSSTLSEESKSRHSSVLE